MAELSVDIVANTQAAVSNIQRMSGALDDVGGDMEKLIDKGRELGKSNEDIARDLSKINGRPFNDVKRDVDRAEQALRDMARTGERAGDDIEDAFDDVQREARSTKDAVGDVDGGFNRIKDGAKEVSSEVGQNLGEAVSSIRGDFSDLGQVGQDTLGGLAATVSSMGPAGLVGAFALAAGAGGLGAVTAGIEDAAAKQERLNEQAAEWAQAYIEAGTSILTTSQIVARGQDIFGDPEKYKEAQTNAKNWGVEVSTAVAAMAGSESAIETVNAGLEKQAEVLEANASGADNYAQNIESATTGQSSANTSYLDGVRALQELEGVMAIGQESAAYYSTMMADVARSTEGATEKTDEFGDTVITLPDGHQVYIDAETGQATMDVEAIEQQIYGIQDKNVQVRVAVSAGALADVENRLRILQNRAAQGITVNVNPGQGRYWE